MIQYVLIFVALAIMFHGWTVRQEQVRHGGYTTEHFHLSHGVSKARFEQMRLDGLGPESLTLFLQLEDRLLKIEKVSVCSGNPRVHEAFVVSNELKEAFPAYDFSYHGIHLKQIAEPNKFINQSLIC